MRCKKTESTKEKIAKKIKDEMTKGESPRKKIIYTMMPAIIDTSVKIAKKTKGITIQPISAKATVTNTTETILPAAEAKQNKTSPLKTETSEETVTIHEHIQKSAQQTAKRFSLQKLQARLTVMASSEEKPVLVPAEQLHNNIKSLNSIVNGLAVSGITKQTPTNMAYIINLALDVGFAYCHNTWKPHAIAAKTGNSLGSPGKDDSQRWAEKVNEIYNNERKKTSPIKRALATPIGR